MNYIEFAKAAQHAIDNIDEAALIAKLDKRQKDYEQVLKDTQVSREEMQKPFDL